jgi:hypothetical protein
MTANEIANQKTFVVTIVTLRFDFAKRSAATLGKFACLLKERLRGRGKDGHIPQDCGLTARSRCAYP